jgi:peptidyl-prolyl cis-trans isomerase B (cyclophilin B)
MKYLFYLTLVSACLLSDMAWAQKGPAKKVTPSHKPSPKSIPAKPKSYPSGEIYFTIETRFGTMVGKLYNETPKHRDNFVKLIRDGFYDSLLFHRVIKDFMIQGGDPLSKNAPPGSPLGMGGPGYTIPAEFNRKLYHRPGVLAAARDNNPEKASSGSQFYIVHGKTFTAEQLVNMQNSRNIQYKTNLLTQITQSSQATEKINDFKIRGDNDGLNKYFTSLQPIIDSIYEINKLDFTSEQIRTYTTQGGTPFLDMEYTVFGEIVEGFQVIDSITNQKTGAVDRPIEDVRMKIRLLNR